MKTIPRLLIGLMLGLLFAGPVLATTLFRDDFQGDGTGWERDAGQGSNTVDFNADGVLKVQGECCGSEFPLVGRNDLFTGISPYWRVALRFRYPAVTAYGTSISVGSGTFTPVRQPAAAPLRPDWHDVLGIHQVRGAEHFLELSAFGTVWYHQDNSAGADTAWHTVELEVNGPDYRLCLDGTEIGAGSTPATIPHTFWAGNYATQPYPGDWTDLEIDWLQVESDLTPPIVQVQIDGAAGNADWYRSALQSTFATLDDWSGINTLEYRLDGGSWQPVAGPVAIQGEGAHTLDYRAVDKADNRLEIQTLLLKIDSLPPISTLTAPAADQWLNGKIVLQGTALDVTSGVATVSYAAADGIWVPAAGTDRWNVDWDTATAPDGEIQLSTRAEDVAGNQEPPNSRRVYIDNTPPETLLRLDQNAGRNGWLRQPVSVTLTAVDAGIGVQSTVYQLDQGGWQAYDSPFRVESEGEHRLVYRSTDALGNQETDQTHYLRIDTRPPQTTVALSGTPGGADWWKSGVTVTLTAVDGSSGIEETAYRLDDGPREVYTAPFRVDGEGIHTLTLRSTDRAGNPEMTQVMTLSIDRLPPQTTALFDGVPGRNGWLLSPVTVVLQAEDAGSGVAEIRYQIDGGSRQSYSEPFVIRGEGLHELSYAGRDRAGNPEMPIMAGVAIDTLPPHTTAQITGPLGQNGWYTGLLTLTFTVTDATSGPAGIYLDGAEVSGTLQVATDGRYALPYFSEDRAGNREPTRLLSFNVDTLLPAADLTGGTFCPECGELLLLRLRAEDGGAGLEVWQLEILNGETVLQRWGGQGTPPAVHPWNGLDSEGNRLPIGRYSIRLIVRDRAGWTQSVTGTVQITAVPIVFPTALPPTENPATPIPTGTIRPAATSTRLPLPTRITPTVTVTAVPTAEKPASQSAVTPRPTPTPAPVPSPAPRSGLELSLLIFEDADWNARRQAAEPGISGVGVRLSDTAGARTYPADPQGIVTLTLTGPGFYTVTLGVLPGIQWQATTRRELRLHYHEDGSLTLLPDRRPVGAADGFVFAFGLAHSTGLWFPWGSAGLLLLTALGVILDRRPEAVEALSRSFLRVPAPAKAHTRGKK